MGVEYGVAIGLKDVHFAIITRDTADGATYEKPFKIGDSISVKPSFEFAEGHLDADDKTVCEDHELMGIKYEINMARIAPEVKAKILGHRLDKNGGIVTRDGDVAPEGALLYRVTLNNRKYKYVCIFKGSFKDFEEEAQTKKRGSKEYQTPTTEYSGYRRADGHLRYEMSEETEGYNPDIIAKWFEEVPAPSPEDMGKDEEEEGGDNVNPELGE